MKLRYDQRVIKLKDGLVRVRGENGSSGKLYTTGPMQLEDLILWVEGYPTIQQCLHYLSLDDKEFLIMGKV